MENLMERYQCSRQTATRYIRQMEHMEKPFMVKESVLSAWERSKTVRPEAEIKYDYLMAKVKKRFTA